MAKKMYCVQECFTGEDWIIMARNKDEAVVIFEECCLDADQEEWELEITKLLGPAVEIKYELKVR